MTGRRPLVVVSNRGPVSYVRGPDGARETRRGGGGLVTALRSLVAQHDVTWVASAITDEDRAVAAEHGGRPFAETARDGSAYEVLLVDHDPAVYDRFYNVVANPTLWFLQHSMWGLPTSPDLGEGFHRAWSEGYVPVNEAFAAATLAELERRPDAAVFWHDYHLYLAPKLVRDARPDVLQALFVHIPWPETDSWTVLPAALRRAIHEGVLAADVLGLHTARWQRNCLRSCADVLRAEVDTAAATVRYDRHVTFVTSHPIGVDTTEFDALREDPAVLAEERGLLAQRPELLVVRVDRTDPSKNVVRGFRAFALCLERHPELHGRATMLALLDPSRQDIPEYAEYVAAIEHEARAVNERFGRGGWKPVDLQVFDNFALSVAAYKQYDVLLVNPVFDGLNLVSKEAPLVNARDGVLVLSENAGSYEELAPWAVGVNPFDIAGQAEALHQALTMPADERRGRLAAMREHLRAHDLTEWSEAQLADLDRAAAARP